MPRNEFNNMSQNEMILYHLKTFGRITPMTAIEEYGCMRLAARISELREQGRKEGFTIETNMVKARNRFGGHVEYAEYIYKEDQK